MVIRANFLMYIGNNRQCFVFTTGNYDHRQYSRISIPNPCDSPLKQAVSGCYPVDIFHVGDSTDQPFVVEW